jgi:predicted nucleic acid-binding protein
VRAVLDTNVVISAAVTSGGVADRLLRLAALRRFTMIFSPKLILEIQTTAGKAYLAAQWNGALLVTGDSRLLKLDPPPSIVTPREFLDMCEARF